MLNVRQPLLADRRPPPTRNPAATDCGPRSRITSDRGGGGRRSAAPAGDADDLAQPRQRTENICESATGGVGLGQGSSAFPGKPARPQLFSVVTCDTYV